MKKSREELHIFRVVNMNERWEDSKLEESVEYELYLGDEYICCAYSFRQLLEFAGNYLDGLDNEWYLKFKKWERNEKITKMTKSKKSMCLVFSIVCLICISGCSGDTFEKTDTSEKIISKGTASQKAGKELKQYESPLVCIYSNYAFNSIEEIYIDTDTKNMYLFREIDSGAGMVQLTTEDGSPKKFEGDLEDYVQY